MFCREVVHRPGSSWYDHPLTSKGEEIESIVAFDNLFVPNERIIARKKRALHGVNFYNVWARHEHWYTFVRIVAKAELYAGLAQLIVDTLELSEVAVVRQRVAEIIEYCQILQGMQLRGRGARRALRGRRDDPRRQRGHRRAAPTRWRTCRGSCTSSRTSAARA